MTKFSVFSADDFSEHENVVFAHDAQTGLKAIIAIHNTNLGPALGGCRFWNYATEQEAVTDALRLSKGMTYKAAVAGLSLGGGKSVIIGDPKKIKSPDLMRAFGRAIDRLNGTYITAEDVGTSVSDMDYIFESTPHVRGRSQGTGDPSPVTAYGTYQGIKAAVKHKFGLESLKGLKVGVQGVGHVGYYLCQMLHKEGADLIVSDINQDSLNKVSSEFGARIVAPNDIYKAEMDIYAPCALGATVNDQTIDLLKATIVAGSANNQLAEDRHGNALKELGILYAPDYVINAGGLINVAHDDADYDAQKVNAMVENIYKTLLTIFERAQKEDVPTSIIADKMAEERFKPSHSIAAE